VRDLRPAPAPDLAHQERLTGLLMGCRPVVERVAPAEVLDLIERELGRPVELRGWGPTAADRAFRPGLARIACASLLPLGEGTPPQRPRII